MNSALLPPGSGVRGLGWYLAAGRGSIALVTHEHEAGIEVPGLPGYRFVALPLEQRDAPVVSEGRYHHSGRFSVAGVPPPMKLLVRFESQPGPLSFGLTGVDAGAYQLGEVGVRLPWLA